MKKQNLQEAINKMKYLTEYHFKSHNRDSSSDQTENPVSFDEVGDVYKQEEPTPEIEETDFPTFDQYRDEVIIDEDEFEDEEQQAQPEQPQAQAPVEQPAPAPEVPQPEQPIAEPQVAPAPVAPPAPAPEVMPEPSVSDDSESMDAKMSAQMAKQDEILAQMSALQAGLMAVQNVSQKIDSVSNEIEELKNPSYDAQHELISKQSYPYNVKLSDFWGWDKEEESTEPEEFTATPEEVNSYNKENIKQSFK